MVKESKITKKGRRSIGIISPYSMCDQTLAAINIANWLIRILDSPRIRIFSYTTIANRVDSYWDSRVRRLRPTTGDLDLIFVVGRDNGVWGLVQDLVNDKATGSQAFAVVTRRELLVEMADTKANQNMLLANPFLLVDGFLVDPESEVNLSTVMPRFDYWVTPKVLTRGVNLRPLFQPLKLVILVDDIFIGEHGLHPFQMLSEVYKGLSRKLAIEVVAVTSLSKNDRRFLRKIADQKGWRVNSRPTMHELHVSLSSSQCALLLLEGDKYRSWYSLVSGYNLFSYSYANLNYVPTSPMVLKTNCPCLCLLPHTADSKEFYEDIVEEMVKLSSSGQVYCGSLRSGQFDILGTRQKEVIEDVFANKRIREGIVGC